MHVRMSAAIRASLALVPISVLVLAACSEAPPDRSTDGPGLALAVAPLSLPDVRDACYGVTITNGLDEQVVTLTGLCADRYGDGVGALSYVAPCDASPGAEQHTVALVLEGLYAGDDQTSPLPTSDYVNPCPASAPCTLPATCEDNADTPVRFDLVVMRRAEQGFFDVVVDFDDIFCSAKLDCLDALMPGADGERLPTVVLGLACTGGELADTCLYLSDVTISCTGECAGAVVPTAAGPGHVDPRNNVGGILEGATVYRGDELIGQKTYWNVAMAIDPDAMAAAGDCTLTATATASDGELAGATPAGTTYPKITFSVPLYQGGQQVCSQHPLDVAGSGVATGYTTPSAPMPVGPAVCHGDDGAVRPLPGCAGAVTTWSSTVYLADGDGDGALDLPPGFDPACIETIEGDLIIVGASAITLSRLTTITRQLVLAASTGASFSFPQLASIGELLIVNQVVSSTIHLPHLVAIGRDLIFAANSDTSLDAPALRTIDGGLELQSSMGGRVAVDYLDAVGRLVISGLDGEAPALGACSLREITSVVNGTQASSLINHANLTSLTLPRLEVIRGSNPGGAETTWLGATLEVTAPALETLALPALREAPYVAFMEVDALVDLDLPALERAGWLVVSQSDALETLSAPRLVEVMQLAVLRGQAFRALDVGALETIDGHLRLDDLPALVSVDAGSLRSLGAISLTGVPNLASLDLSALETFTGRSIGMTQYHLTINGPSALTSLDLSSLVTATNFVQVTFHASLESIDLSSLVSAQALVVTDNPLLDTLALDSLTTLSLGMLVATNPLLSHAAMTAVVAQLVPPPPTINLCGLSGGPACP